jgi:hypothetical protein
VPGVVAESDSSLRTQAGLASHRSPRKSQGPARCRGGAHHPAICVQQSITLPPEAGAKLAQYLCFGSPEWRERYGTLRNAVEGFNGFVKDGAHEALDDPGGGGSGA